MRNFPNFLAEGQVSEYFSNNKITIMKYEPDARNIGYCKGFVDGYEQGIRNNPYDGGSVDKEELLRHLQYKLGYDAGVAVYCQEIDKEDFE